MRGSGPLFIWSVAALALVVSCTLLTDTDDLTGGGATSTPSDASLETSSGSNDATSSSSSSGSPSVDAATRDVVEPPDPAAELVAEYVFDETTGLIAHDHITPALDLVIPNTGTSWSSGLSVTASSIISSGVAASKIVQRIEEAKTLSVEVWVEPGNITQGGPARIVTLSPGPDSDRVTFMVGQEGNSFVFRTRSHSALTMFAGGRATIGRHQVVGVAEATGARHIYVDGNLAATDVLSAEFQGAEKNTPLTVANEPTGDRTWLGRLLSLSIFARALSPVEVAQRFDAGPR